MTRIDIFWPFPLTTFQVILAVLFVLVVYWLIKWVGSIITGG